MSGGKKIYGGCVSMTKIKGVIFDWAGTTVDFGCFAPVEVFIRIFKEANVEVTYEEARKPMGMLKIDHIRTMLAMPRIQQAWQEVHGQPSSEKNVEKLYASFEQLLMEGLAQYTEPIPHVVEVVEQLQAEGYRIGSTTGYTKAMMEVVRAGAKEKGYEPAFIATAEDVGGIGRPAPFMIFENMKHLGLTSVHEVVKVGDTVSDIKEGLHAGVTSIGVIIGSSEMGLSEAEYDALTVEERTIKIAETRAKFEAVGAHYTIETMAALPELLQQMNAQEAVRV